MGIKMWKMIGGASGAKTRGDLCFLVPSGYVAEINEDACVGCGTCVEACNFACMTMKEENETPHVDLEKCMGCGGCEAVCPEGAIRLRLDPSKGAPLDVEQITPGV
jgi:NAD-dependent dihydropyrimidine dehydrogenase PreA subunit